MCIRDRYRLLPFAEAVRGLHFPASMEALEQARRTVAFSEMLVFQLAMRELRAGSRAKPAYPMQLKEMCIRDSYNTPPTGCQRFFQKMLGKAMQLM